MLAIKKRAGKAMEWARGPYRKRGERVLRIEARGGVRREVPVRALSEGVEIAQGIVAKLGAEGLELGVPARTRVVRIGAARSRVIWDGTALAAAQPAVALAASLDDLIHIEHGGTSWMLETAYAAPALAVVAGGPRVARSTWMSLLQSGVFHLIVALLVTFGGHALSKLWVDVATTEEKQEEKLDPRTETQLVEISSAGSDFNGRGLTVASAPQGAVPNEGAKQEKIAGELSGLVARMAKAFGKADGTVKVVDGGTAAASAAMAGLANRAGKGQRTDLSGSFKKVGQGNAGSGARWDLFAGDGNAISAKDLEAVNEIFRQLQDNFRGCYESALLKYDQLAVSVQYEAEVTADGRLGTPSYEVSGKRSDESESALKSCLTSVLRKVSLNRRVAGARIRNQFVFRS